MRTWRPILAAFALASLIGAASCSSVDQTQKSSVANANNLVGKWMSNDGQETIEFTADGKFQGQLKYGMGQRPRNLSGTYFSDGPKIAFTVDGDQPMTWEYKFSGDDIIFTYLQGGMVKMDGTMARFTHAN